MTDNWRSHFSKEACKAKLSFSRRFEYSNKLNHWHYVYANHSCWCMYSLRSWCDLLKFLFFIILRRNNRFTNGILPFCGISFGKLRKAWNNVIKIQQVADNESYVLPKTQKIMPETDCKMTETTNGIFIFFKIWLTSYNISVIYFKWNGVVFRTVSHLLHLHHTRDISTVFTFIRFENIWEKNYL